MKVCILDFETTGLDTSKALPLELGWIVTDENFETIEQAKNMYFKHTGIKIPQRIVDLTGITAQKLIDDGEKENVVAETFLKCTEDVGLFIAHNAKFDREIMAGLLKRVGPPEKHPVIKKKKWLCSAHDIEYPDFVTCKKLTHICTDYKIFPEEGEEAHTASSDCLFLWRLLAERGDGATELIKQRDEPVIYLKADVSFKDRNKAKEDGYRWQGDRSWGLEFPKTWVKRVRESKIGEEKEREVPFQRYQLSPEQGKKVRR